MLVTFDAMKNNPFPTNYYLGEEFFCDRETETQTLVSGLLNGNSMTLTAIRRMGKTGLIHHVLEKLKSEMLPIYLDILPTNDKTAFVKELSTAIVNAVPEKSPIGKKIWDFIKTLRPVISFDPLTGNPQVSITGTQNDADKNIDALLKFLNNLDQKVVIAVDEFQQILAYPEKNTDAWLRSIIQTLTNVVFIFSGSQRHLITELFSDSRRPFYRSTQILHFGSIVKDSYKQFIIEKFEEAERSISPEVVEDALEWASVHTYYVQLICNRLFANAPKEVTEKDLNREIIKILEEQEIVFFQYRELLTKPQWNLLMAIGLEEKVGSPTSMGFINKYKLGSSASVLRSLQSLEQKEMIYSDPGENGQKQYQVYDVLLKRWLQYKFQVHEI